MAYASGVSTTNNKVTTETKSPVYPPQKMPSPPTPIPPYNQFITPMLPQYTPPQIKPIYYEE